MIMTQGIQESCRRYLANTFDCNINMRWLSREPASVEVRKSAEKGSNNQPSASDRRFQVVLEKPGTTNQMPRRLSQTKRQWRPESSPTMGRWLREEQNIKGSEQCAAKNTRTKYARGRTAKEGSTPS